jgi:hypothetical protein
MTSAPSSPRQFWAGAIAGWTLITIGIIGLVGDRSATAPISFAKWFIGIAVVHDVVLAPLVLFASWVAGRALPHRAVLPVRVGLATTALLVLYSWPLVRGYGRRDANPSALPLSYGRNLLVSLIVLWSVVAIWVTVHWWSECRDAVRTSKVSR